MMQATKLSAPLIFTIIPTMLLAGANPLLKTEVVFEEVNGLVTVEAEHYSEQEKDEVRAWYLATTQHPTEAT